MTDQMPETVSEEQKVAPLLPLLACPRPIVDLLLRSLGEPLTDISFQAAITAAIRLRDAAGRRYETATSELSEVKHELAVLRWRNLAAKALIDQAKQNAVRDTAELDEAQRLGLELEHQKVKALAEADQLAAEVAELEEMVATARDKREGVRHSMHALHPALIGFDSAIKSTEDSGSLQRQGEPGAVQLYDC